MTPALFDAVTIHPLFVHFPIAFWIAALGFWAVSLFRSDKDFWRMGRWLLNLGTGCALLAGLTGYLEAGQLGHDSPGHALVHVHRNWMIGTTILALICTGLAFLWRGSNSRKHRWIQVALMLGTVFGLVLGADRGASLVYTFGVGVQDSPPVLTPVEGHGHGHEHGH